MRLAIGVIAFASAGAAHAAADACKQVEAATIATLNAPAGVRQYIASREQGPERLVSVITGDTVYVALAPGRWSRQPRAAQRDAAIKAQGMKKLTDCRAAGQETVAGEPATIVEYKVEFEGLPAMAARAWIGKDGLLRKQSTAGRGYVRYEYTDVRAPL
jgi:hypothetical protein